MTPTEYAKAIVGALLAGLTALGTALTDGAVTATEWVGVAVAALATFGGVFGVRNTTTPRHRGEVGALDNNALVTIAVVLGIVVLAVILLRMA